MLNILISLCIISIVSGCSLLGLKCENEAILADDIVVESAIKETLKPKNSVSLTKYKK